MSRQWRCEKGLTSFDSCIQPSKLTAMVYTALQIISRGRENGVSVLDLGKKSGYDQKTCFYIIKQLVELGLVYVLIRGLPKLDAY